MINSSLAAIIGLALAIVLIIKKISPVYSLMIGALAGGFLGCGSLVGTVSEMFEGVKSITPAILRILAAGVLSGALIRSRAAESIAESIVRRLGPRFVFLSLALATMILCAVGVFVDVAVITVAPVALALASRLGLSRGKVLLALIGGGKCGNIMSPNPNTIIAAENYGAPLSSVMAAGIIPALIGLLVTVYIIVPLLPSGKARAAGMAGSEGIVGSEGTTCSEGTVGSEGMAGEKLPSFLASIAGPLFTIALLSLRPLFGIVIDPMIALPLGGIVTLAATRSLNITSESIEYGLSKMAPVALLLIGTGTIAGVISASDMKDVVISWLTGWNVSGMFMAPLSSILMSAATASTTAGATIASASFSDAILETGLAGLWGAALTNAGATVLDHLPHGSFFHASAGSVSMPFKERLSLIPFESLIGLTLTLTTILCAVIGNIAGLC